ncbi:MAG TPA: TonB-dependent receptor [Terriglobales bacterium]|nr:TonB-dependent receptor [Terriglobales bacterium]
MARRADFRFCTWSFFLTVVFLVHQAAFGQGSYTAQVRGTVTDPAHALVGNAKVTATNESTNIATTATTNTSGEYVMNGLRPASYSIKVEMPGFREVVRTGLVLAVSQQATVDFTLSLSSATESITVTDTAPLLDTGSSSLGTDVTNEFVSRMPLQGRDATQLVYLSAGVTTLNNADAYPEGTNFSSNGQRYGSAEIRLDGNLATGPEQGEGATNNLSYMPSTEVIQEFKVQNNSFAAEFGSNGGTVVNVLMKSGTNNFHGSGWWFGQRPWLNANDFFSNRDGVPRGGGTHDQYGFSVGGPIFKGKTFFLFDMEKQRNISKNLVQARVPTPLEREGNFTQTITQDNDGNATPVKLFNPFDVDTDPTHAATFGDRAMFPVDPVTGSTEVIPTALMSPVWLQLNAMNAFPLPTGPINSSNVNFTKPVTETTPTLQFDVKIDHQLTNNVHLSGRYSQNSTHDTSPGLFFDGSETHVTTRNIALEHTWSIRPNLLLTSRFGLERYYQNETPQTIDPTTFGFQPILAEANNIMKMTEVNVDNYSSLMGGQCCINTINGHTQYVYSSSLNWVKGNHVLKFGGEQRLFFNNFFQPDDATGLFHFSGSTTAQNAFNDPNTQDGDGLAALELGWPTDGHINIKPAVLEKSKQTDFYAQDDWKVTSKLTVSLGLRYEWSVPYTERYNRIQFSNFTGNSGVTVDLTPASSGIVDNNGDSVNLSSLGLGPTQLRGTTTFPTSGDRHVPIDRNNFGPRVGFAYQVANNTVLRGGVGLFYGLSSATNFQYPGTAFQDSAQFHISLDGGLTLAPGWALNNVFPTLPTNTLPHAQGTTYGALAEWGQGNGNDLATSADRNPEIYQWNLGLQHLLPAGIVISADYSGNRSTHLPWGGATRNRDTLPTAARELCDSTCQSSQVPNPFQSMFVGPTAVFNEPDSIYNFPTIPEGNLLRRFPQFDGDFEGLPLLAASSWYNGLLVRFQKKASHGLSFEGNYTWSKATDYSSYGANSFIFFGGSGLGNPQDINNLKAEHSIGANDTPQRAVLAAVYDLPFGRKRWMGGNMNRFLDAIVGGWSVNALITLQSGQPIPFALANSSIADGQQRPDITCSQLGTGLSMHDVAFSNDPNASYFNGNCLTPPADQVPGNAPRFSSSIRSEGIRNTDMGFFKDFEVKEGMKLQLRAEFFNLTNSVRFATPDSFLGDSDFGKVEQTANHPRDGQIAVRFEF